MSQIYLGTVIKVQKNDPKTVRVKKITHRSHPKYKKIITLIKKYAVHNENFSLQVGDKVWFKNFRPCSKTKRFLITEKITKKELSKQGE